MANQKQLSIHQFERSDVEIRSEEISFNGFFKVQTLKLRHRQFGGGCGKFLTRELFVRGPATCMLPYDPHTDRVVVCEQFRVGALNYGYSPWLLELVARINDPGESPVQTAIREAEEEAGLQVKELVPICEYYPSPGGSDEWITLLCGRVDSREAEGVYGLAEEGEDIRVHVFSRQQAFDLIANGHINNAASIIGLQWLQLNHAELQKKWC
jgi:ADP-ribose diphosphatase